MTEDHLYKQTGPYLGYTVRLYLENNVIREHDNIQQVSLIRFQMFYWIPRLRGKPMVSCNLMVVKGLIINALI